MKARRPARDDPTRQGVKLRHTIVLSMTALLVLSVVAVSLLWYRAGLRITSESIRNLQQEIAHRIHDHLERFLAVPQEILQANAAAFRVLESDSLAPWQMEHLFLAQVLIFESVSSIYAGFPNGGLVDAGREQADGSLYVIETEGFRAGTFDKYRVDETGRRLELVLSLPSFDARTRPWYVAAIQERRSTWSDIYVLFSGQDMAIAASRPVYDEFGELVLVLSTDIFLSQIDEFMGSLDYGSTGIGFIMDQSGFLVASSTDAPNLATDPDGLVRRVPASSSPSPLIRAATRYVATAYGSSEALGDEIAGVFRFEGERHHLLAASIQDELGVEWTSVLVIPERDFRGAIRSGTFTTLAFLLIALLLVLVIGFTLATRIARPLEQLTRAVHSFGQGTRVVLPAPSKTREIHDLSLSFQAMTNQLRQTLDNLHMLIEKAPIAIFVANAQAQYTDVNPAACQMTGYTREELLNLGIPGLIGEELSPEDIEIFSQLRRKGSASGEVLVHKKDGSDLWIQIEAVALTNDRLVAFCTDITRRRATEETLRHQQKMEALGTMASGVAHEINNPLMGMMSFAELIEGHLEDESTKAHVRSILREGERIAHIVRNLLAFSRGDRGIRQAADLRSIVEDSLPLVRNAMLRSNVTLKADLAETIPEIQCSRPQIQQVLINVLMNARDALDEKYPGFDEDKVIRISVQGIERKGETWVRLEITDHGTGLSTEVANLVFDPFFTTGQRDEKTGLGLTISYGIVQEHGGEISIQSAEGEGTTVTIDLPAIGAS